MLTQKRTWIGLFFIVFTSYFLFRNIDKDKLLEAITQFHFIWLLPALALYLFGYVVRGYRWVVLLSPVKKCSFQSLFPTLMVGFMANNIFPARAGELIRAHLNGTKEHISRSASFATIVLERLFDGLTMIILLWTSLSWGNLPIREAAMPYGIRFAIHWSPYVFGTTFLVLFSLVLFKKKTAELLNAFIRLAPKKLRKTLGQLAHTFVDGLHILQNIRETFLVLTASLAAWSCEFTAYFILAVGIGIAPTPLSLWSAALLMAIVNLGILIPNAPGGIGLFEFIGVALLLPFGVSKEMSLCYMILVHLMVWIPITLLGAYYYTREHMNFSSLRDEEKIH